MKSSHILPRARRSCIGLSLACVLYSGTLWSGEESYNDDWRWVHFTTQSGLPSNSVVDLAETRQGIVWAATTAGLAWYDGFRWHPTGPPDTVRGNHAPRLFLLGGNTVYAIISNTLYLADTAGLTAPRLRAGGTEPAPVAVAPAEDNGLLLMTSSEYYYFGAGESRRLQGPAGAVFEGESPVTLSQSGGLWVSTQDGICRWDGHGWTLKMRAAAKPYRIQRLVESVGGTSLASIDDPSDACGLWEWKNGGSPRRIAEEGRNISRTMDISPSGEVFIVRRSGEVRIRRGSRWSSLTRIPPQLVGASFIKFRRNGDLWAGTENGLFLCKRSSMRWTSWRDTATGFDDHIHELLRTRDGSLWIATKQGIEIRRPNGTSEFIREISGQKLLLVTGLCEDNEGNVWISSGGWFQGAYRWDGSHWRHFGTREGLTAERVHKIRKDRHGRLWFLGIGASSGATHPGAFVFADGAFRQWTSGDGLMNDRVYAFEESIDGSLWFGTSGGISRFHGGQWTRWTMNEGLLSPSIFTIALDPAGRLWFGDQSTGLGLVDGNDRLRHYSTADGLVNNSVFDVKCDSMGKLWIATRGGLSSYCNGTWSSFTRSSGLTVPELWPLLAEDEKIYIGTDGSGVKILERSEERNPPPRVDIHDTLVEGDRIVIRWTALPYWGEMPAAEVGTRYSIDGGPWSGWSTGREASRSGLTAGGHLLRVQAKGLFGQYDPAGQSVTFAVAPSIFFRAPFVVPLGALALGTVYLASMLILRKRRDAAALRSSEARFRCLTEAAFEGIIIHDHGRIIEANPSVLAMFGFQYDEFVGRPVADFIAPPSRDELVRLIETETPNPCEASGRRKNGEGLIVEMIAKQIPFDNRTLRVVAIRDITERKRSDEELLAYQKQLRALAAEASNVEERERRRLAACLHESIGQSLALCKMKLQSLQRPVPREVADARLKESISLVEESIHHSRRLTFELSPPILHELGVVPAIEWFSRRFQEQHGIAVAFVDDGWPKPLKEEVGVSLFNAVREILVNILKHAQASHVRIEIGGEDHMIAVIIDDDGVGFNSTEIPGHAGHRDGFGLFSIRERLALLGGRSDVESRPGHGTRVVLTVPLSRAGEPAEAGT